MTDETNRIPLNLIFDYPVHWSKYKVLRDLLQNFFDSVPRDEWSTRFSHSLEGSRLRLTAADVSFSYDWLVPIGASTKRDGGGEHAGYFGEGFKIAALCAVRDYGWDIQVHSRRWHLQVVTDTLTVDGRALRALAYDVRQRATDTRDTVLTLSPFNDPALLNVALLSLFHPHNPLLGELIWSGPSAAVYFRSSEPKPPGFPSTDRAAGPGIVFAGFQALGSIPHPLVFCRHDHRGKDRERNNFFLMDVIGIVGRIASRLPPDAAAQVLRVLDRHWYEYPRKRYDFDSWYPIVQTLRMSRANGVPDPLVPGFVVLRKIRRSCLSLFSP